MVDQRRMVASFDCADTAPAAARHWVASVLDSWQIYARRNDVLLLLSELVNIAVGHGRFDVDVAVTAASGGTSPAAIHVEVFEDGGHPAALNDISLRREHGRGLHLVDSIADRWGYRQVPIGESMWFDLSV